METFFEILKFTIPALIVLGAVYFVIKKLLDAEEKKQLLEFRKDGQKMVTPVRLQAYERATLFLERIHPESLLSRTNQSGMSARLLQGQLLKTIRSEFDHNVSQQIYMSDDAWMMLKNAKEETIKIINLASARVRDEASGLELSKAILEVCMKIGKLPAHTALEFIKREIRQNF